MFNNYPALPYAVAVVFAMAAIYSIPLSITLLPTIILLVLCSAIALLLRNNRRFRTFPLFIASLVLAAYAMSNAKEQNIYNDEAHYEKLCGTIIDTPRQTAHHTLITLYIQQGALKGKKIRTYLPERCYEQVKLGESYEVYGNVTPFYNFNTEESNFNYVRWAQARGLLAQMWVREGAFSKVDSQLEALPFLERITVKGKLLRGRLIELFRSQGMAEEHISMLSAMAFGERSAIDQDTREMFALTGVAHLLALSGLHLSILYMLLYILLARGVPRVVGNTMVVVAVWLYVVIVGMPISVVRAAVMLTICTFLAIDDTRRLTANSLAIAVIVMLFVNPMTILDVSFYMSVGAVFSLFVFNRPLYNLVNPMFLNSHRLVRWLWTAVVVSTSAQIGVLPVVIYFFGYISTYFLLANIVAVLLVTFFLYCVFLALLFWWLPPVRFIFLSLITAFLTALTAILSLILSFKGVAINNLHISTLQLIILYLIVALLAVLVIRVSAIIDKRRIERVSL